MNFTYGKNTCLPYSVGLLRPILQSDPFVKSNCEFILLLCEEIEVAAAKAANADVLGISRYIWNWEYSKALAIRVKSLNSKIKIIAGGPQIPHKDKDLFAKHPYFDLVVIREGEVTFNEEIKGLIENSSCDFSEVSGISLTESFCP